MNAPAATMGDGPRIVPTLISDRGGVDYLGLRQVNLDLTTNCIPGINNVTYFIGPFAVFSWLHWKFHAALVEAMRRDGLEFYEEKPTQPQWPQDHLATLLSLLEDCGLLSSDGKRFQFESDSL